MPITVHIEGKNAAEVAQLVHDLSITIRGIDLKDIPAETKVSTLDPKPVAEEATATEPEVSEPEASLGEEENIPTDVELRAAAASKAKSAEGKAKVKALLEKYDVPNVTGVPNGKRTAFLRDLEAL